MPTKPYQRQEVRALLERLSEPPRFLIFVAGPRQVGKTTLVRDALSRYEHSKYHFIPVDQLDVLHLPGFASSKDAAYVQDARPRDTAWLVAPWQRARAATRGSDDGLIL